MCFPGPSIPDPPPPAAPAPVLDPNELAARRATALKRQTSRDSFVIDQASSSQPQTGLKIGQ
jgi:hypothetical protein